MNDPNPTASPLQQSLLRLHAELARTPTVEEGSRQLLGQLLGDIERLLREPGARAPESLAARPAAQSRLEALAIEFEADHPSLAASVRQFVDLLGRAGL